MDGLVDPLAYDSGARYVTVSSGLGTVGATVTVHRVGSVVTIAVSEASGNLLGSGGSFWISLNSAAFPPVGFRPSATLTDGKFQLRPDGTVAARGPGGYAVTDGAVFTFVVSGAPPSSFTWGTAV